MAGRTAFASPPRMLPHQTSPLLALSLALITRPLPPSTRSSSSSSNLHFLSLSLFPRPLPLPTSPFLSLLSLPLPPPQAKQEPTHLTPSLTEPPGPDSAMAEGVMAVMVQRPRPARWRPILAP